MSPAAGGAVRRRRVRLGRKVKFLCGHWLSCLKNKYFSETSDSTQNRIASTIGNWYPIKDPRDPSRKLNGSDGIIQQIGCDCLSQSSPEPVWMWHDTLLDTGTSINLTNEITLREYELDHLIIRYGELHNSPGVTVYDGQQLTIVGEIKITLKWKKNDGIIFNNEEHTVNFKVIQASTESSERPTYPFIIGKTYMDDMRISVLPDLKSDEGEATTI